MGCEEVDCRVRYDQWLMVLHLSKYTVQVSLTVLVVESSQQMSKSRFCESHEKTFGNVIIRFLWVRSMDVDNAAPDMEVGDAWVDVVPRFIRGFL